VKRVVSACCSLEGGGRPFPEGLGDSCRPCTTRLSVAGLLAVLSLFLGSGRFIPEVRKAEPYAQRPPSLTSGVKSVKHRTAGVYCYGYGRYTGRHIPTMVHLPGYTGGIYHHGTPTRYTAGYTPPRVHSRVHT